MNQSNFWQKLMNSRAMQALYRERVRNIMVGVVYVLVVVILLSGNMRFDEVFTLDEVAPHTIQSPIQARIEDTEHTEQLRKEAEDAVSKSYLSDENAVADSAASVHDFYRQVNEIIVYGTIPVPMEQSIEPEKPSALPQSSEKGTAPANTSENTSSSDTTSNTKEGTKTELPTDNESTEPAVPAFDAGAEMVPGSTILTENGRLYEIERLVYQYYQKIPDSKSEDAEALAKYLMGTTADERTQLENLTSYLVGISMSKPITEDILESTRDTFVQQVVNTGFSAEGEKIISLVGAASVQANMIYDEASTLAAKQEARDAIQPVEKTVKAGEIIVREGERITAEQLSTLEQLGLQGGKFRVEEYVGLILLVLITSTMIIMMIRRYYPVVYKEPKNFYMIAMIMVIILFLSRVLMLIQISSVPEIHETASFLAPAAACSFLIAILIDQRVAYFVNMILTLYLGIMCEDYAIITMGLSFTSGVASVYMVTHFSRTSDLARSGVYVALVNVLMVMAFSLLDSNIDSSTALYGILTAGLSGFLSMILTVGLLPYFEGLFSMTSNMRLLEMADPNTPLLKKLLTEAPGTYHHSLMVGNLAEATADLVHADPVLVRVGAYYHDIGKMKHPEYFVENQQNMENPHNKISPILSAMIVIDHVRSGIKMAKEYDLPPQITDFIMSHHGTSLTGYFYIQACNEDGKENVNADNFRYDGPKPHSKEVALVMLADSCEAAVRSVADPTPEKIQTMVHNIVRGKLNDGQLSDCELTFHDLDVIEERFCQVLENIYHKRIAYPDAKK